MAARAGPRRYSATAMSSSVGNDAIGDGEGIVMTICKGWAGERRGTSEEGVIYHCAQISPPNHFTPRRSRIGAEWATAAGHMIVLEIRVL